MLIAEVECVKFCDGNAKCNLSFCIVGCSTGTDWKTDIK